jgi:hypothetical protein
MSFSICKQRDGWQIAPRPLVSHVQSPYGLLPVRHQRNNILPPIMPPDLLKQRLSKRGDIYPDTGGYRELNGRGVPIIMVGKSRMNGFSPAHFDQLYQ